MKQKRGFTLVELIIVIAVIGVLAAILIPVFANVIEKSNVKSAMSDARNAVSIYIADSMSANNIAVMGEGSVIKVKKAGKDFYFTFSQGEVKEGDGTDGANASDALTIDYSSVTVLAYNINSEYDTSADRLQCADATVLELAELPKTVVMYITNVTLTVSGNTSGGNAASPQGTAAMNTADSTMAAFAADNTLPDYTNGTMTISRQSDGNYYAAIFTITSDENATYYTTTSIGTVTQGALNRIADSYDIYAPSGAALSFDGATVVSSLASETYVFIYHG